MLKDVLWAIGLFVFIFVFVGIPYIKGAIESNKQSINKRDYVAANLDKFGVKDNGPSFENKDIYLITHERIGL